MISKEELKAMYYYVGPYIYKNRLVRVFKTKTKNSKYVFYYDNKGELTLMGFRASNELAKALNTDIKVLYDVSDSSYFDVDLNDVNLNSIFFRKKAKQTKPESAIETPEVSDSGNGEALDLESEETSPEAENEPTWRSIESNSMEARLIPNSEDGTKYILEIRDLAGVTEEPYVARMSLESKLEIEGTVYPLLEFMQNAVVDGILENYENYKEVVTEPDTNKMLQRNNGEKITICNDISYLEGNKNSASLGFYDLETKDIAINFSSTTQLDNVEGAMKNVFKHEHGHSIADNRSETKSITVGLITINNGIEGIAATEVINVLFAKDTVGYSKLKEKAEALFGNDIPKEVFDAYFKNDPEQFKQVTADAIGSTKEEAQLFWSRMDYYYRLGYSDSLPNMTPEQQDALFDEQGKLIDRQIVQIKVNQLEREGKATPEAIQELYDRFNVERENSVENVVEKETTQELTQETTQEAFFSGYTQFKQDMEEGEVEEVNPDYAHYYAVTSDPETILNDIDIIETKFDSNSRLETQANLLSYQGNNVNEHTEQLKELHETHPEYYNETIKTSMISGSSAFVSDEMVCQGIPSMYEQLTEEERSKIVTEVSKVPGKEQFDLDVVKDVKEIYERNTENKFFVNEETVKEVLDNVISDISLENVDDKKTYANELLGNDIENMEIDNTCHQKVLGEEGYEKAVEETREINPSSVQPDGSVNISDVNLTCEDIIKEEQAKLEQEKALQEQQQQAEKQAQQDDERDIGRVMNLMPTNYDDND